MAEYNFIKKGDIVERKDGKPFESGLKTAYVFDADPNGIAGCVEKPGNWMLDEYIRVVARSGVDFEHGDRVVVKWLWRIVRIAGFTRRGIAVGVGESLYGYEHEDVISVEHSMAFNEHIKRTSGVDVRNINDSGIPDEYEKMCIKRALKKGGLLDE